MSELLKIERRQLLQHALLLVGATAAGTLSPEALARAAAAPARYLSKPRFALLGAVADTIVPATDTPGALAAHVPERLDALLRGWAAPATRTEIEGALDRIDAAAKAQKGKAFAALSAADREAVLRPHDAAALKSAPPPPGSPKPHPFANMSFMVDQGYYRIKDLVLALYYYSAEATATELAYVHNPGTYRPSIKLTAASRPELGTGTF